MRSRASARSPATPADDVHAGRGKQGSRKREHDQIPVVAEVLDPPLAAERAQEPRPRLAQRLLIMHLRSVSRSLTRLRIVTTY